MSFPVFSVGRSKACDRANIINKQQNNSGPMTGPCGIPEKLRIQEKGNPYKTRRGKTKIC